jgi:isopentenyl-diphosphate delta-isomerase
MSSTRDRSAPASERVVLVDAHDAEVGTAGKLEAHRSGRLHRAFSVFVFNRAGEMLLQRRAADKYHSPGRWSNACCGHPRPGEDTRSAARRRLQEEMGIDCALTPVTAFTYCADVGEGLVENEYDHVFVGWTDTDPRPDPAEADAWCWVPVAEVRRSLKREPERYSAWFALALRGLFAQGIPDTPGTGPTAGSSAPGDVPEDQVLHVRGSDAVRGEQ